MLFELIPFVGWAGKNDSSMWTHTAYCVCVLVVSFYIYGFDFTATVKILSFFPLFSLAQPFLNLCLLFFLESANGRQMVFAFISKLTWIVRNLSDIHTKQNATVLSCTFVQVLVASIPFCCHYRFKFGIHHSVLYAAITVCVCVWVCEGLCSIVYIYLEKLNKQLK